MKKIILSAALLPLVVLTSCSSLTDKLAVKFDADYSSDVAVKGLPGNPSIPSTGAKMTLFSAGYATESEKHIKEHNTSSDLLKEAMLTALTIEMKAPNGQNFDLADSIWVYLSAKGISEIKAAHKFGIAKNTTKINLDLESFNAKDYYLKDSIFLRVEGRVYKPLDTATVVNLAGKVAVTANPLEKKK